MMNNVTLVGRTVKDVELRYTQGENSKAVATITLAVNRDYKNQQGQVEADFPQVVLWGKQAETFANFVKKGDRVGIVGQLRTRSYGEEGNKTYVTEVLASSFSSLQDKKPQQ